MVYYPRIRFVTFDILHTLITPRAPIHVQYAEVYKPFLGPLSPEDIRKSFKTGKQKLNILMELLVTFFVDIQLSSALKTSGRRTHRDTNNGGLA